MRLEQTPRPDHVLRVTARLVTSSAILHLSSDELERAVNQEQMENPVLEVIEQRTCLFCGARLYGQVCSACGNFEQMTQLTPRSEPGRDALFSSPSTPSEWAYESQTFYDIDNYGFADVDSADDSDPLAYIPTDNTLPQMLLQQLETLVAPDEASIAEQLVGNLNERGYLEISIQDIAEALHVPVERVAYVLNQLQTLEPLGIGARNLRECLLIQLQALNEQSQPHPLADSLIDRYLDQLGHNQYHEIARSLKVPEQEVRAASQYIRNTLHPFPAQIYQADMPYTRSVVGTSYIHPDVIIRQGETGFEVELIEEKRYHFSINTDYCAATAPVIPEAATREMRRYMHQQSERAKFFVDCVSRRWRTLKRVALLVTDYQRLFLEKGIRYLRPLTRAEVAIRLNLDEGTVSRATANKYALLPNGRLMPISDFFDGSLGIKDILRELLDTEDGNKHRLSDEELARQLTARGIPIARRTVTKYREEMGIGSSRERSS